MDIHAAHIQDHLGTSFSCECGRRHKVQIEMIEISADILCKIPKVVQSAGYQKPFIIMDKNTYEVAGRELTEAFTEKEIPFAEYIFPDSRLVPDEAALGRILINYDEASDLIIGVGAGTINDLARYFSHRLRLPYYIVATAPSIDGYASTGAALIRNKLKTTFQCQMPQAIFADLNVIAKAPKEMIAAGFCDVIGKYICLADWELASIINDEYYCKKVADLTRESLERTVAQKEGIAQGKEEAIAGLMEALIMAGIAMSYVGNSRPASGSEHHLSHFWEMHFLLENKEPILHGTKVGIGAILVAGLYELLRTEKITSEQIRTKKPSSDTNWEDKIKRTFLEAATEVILLEEETQKNSLELWSERIKVIAERWEQISQVLASVPVAEKITDLISIVGGATNPADVEIEHELVKEAIIYAKEVRARYTILQLLWDLGYLHDYAQSIASVKQN